MNFSEALREIKRIFLDTAPIIYFIEAHDQFGPLVKQVVEGMNEKSDSGIYICSDPYRSLAEAGRNRE